MKDWRELPESASGKRMMGYISDYDDSYVMKWLYEVIGREMDDAKQRFAELRLQMDPETATWGLGYWEQRYHLQPDPSLTVEQRRRRVSERRNRSKRRPMNPARMAGILYNLFDVEARIDEHTGPFTYAVILHALPGRVDEAAVRVKLNQIKQSHMSYTIGYEQGTAGDLYLGGAVAAAKEFVMKQVN